MHARVDGTVIMITTPEILRVTLKIFDNFTQTLWMIVMHSIFGRKFGGRSLVVLILPILNRTKYRVNYLDWQSVINDGHELLCKADMLQFN